MNALLLLIMLISIDLAQQCHNAEPATSISSDACQQATDSSAGPSRLQVAAGFSWDVGLSSLKPASAAQEGDSSDEEEQDASGKVS